MRRRRAVRPVTCSSSSVLQSGSASQRQLSGMQRPLAQRNSSAAQVRAAQCAPSSEPSAQSESRSHTHTIGRHLPPLEHTN